MKQSLDHHVPTAHKARHSRGSWVSLLLELTKAKVVVLVTVSTAAGYILFAGKLQVEVLLPMAGILLLACGSASLNQVQDARFDALMNRTRNRPIPTGRLDKLQALFIAITLILLGLSALSSVDRHVATVLTLSVTALVWYNVVYTYLKRITSFAVVPGSLIGAIAPLIGWSAAGGESLDPRILMLSFFLFLWQIPHFWLLLLIYGREYEQAGLPSPTRTLSPSQLRRISFLWMFACALSGLILALLSDLRLPARAALVLVSVWLASCSLSILKPRCGEARFKRAFVQLILFVLAIMTVLMLDALL